MAVRRRRASGSTQALRVGVAENRFGVARVGFAIPKATGSAVVRNRLRRQLREALRPRLEALAGVDVVVTARPDAATLGWREVVDAVSRSVETARRALAAPHRRGGRTP